MGAMNLVDKVDRLRHNLLPAQFAPLGSYGNQDLVDDRSSAFVLLCHAEFEVFLEEFSRQRMLDAVEAWRTSQLCTPVAMALLAFYYSPDRAKNDYKRKDHVQDSDGDAGKTSSASVPSLDVRYILEKVADDHRHVINNNLGIKEDNLRKLLEPVAVSLASLDPHLIIDIDSFGHRRGEIAHSSYSSRKGVDPKQVYEEAHHIAVRLSTLANKDYRPHESLLGTISWMSAGFRALESM